MIPNNVVYDALFDFSKEEPKQFKEYDPDSTNLLLPLYSILESTAPLRNEHGDVLHISETRVFGRFLLLIPWIFGKATIQ